TVRPELADSAVSVRRATPDRLGAQVGHPLEPHLHPCRRPPPPSVQDMSGHSAHCCSPASGPTSRCNRILLILPSSPRTTCRSVAGSFRSRCRRISSSSGPVLPVAQTR